MACSCLDCELRHRSSRHSSRSAQGSPAPNPKGPSKVGYSYGTQGSWIDGPDHPAVSKEAVQQLQDKEATLRSSASHLDLEEAFTLADEALGEHKWTELPCLKQTQAGDVFYSYRDLPFMVFDALDERLFRSVLKGNVYICWAPLPGGIYGTTSRPGLNGSPRITIKLNSRAPKDPSVTLGALLHQMIHAYYLQCCGHKNKKVVGKGYNLSHGEGYHNLYRSIKDHFLPGEPPVWKVARISASGPHGVPRYYYDPKPGVSNCGCYSFSPKKKEINQWRKTATTMAIAKSTQKALKEHTSSKGSSTDSHPWYDRNAPSIPIRLQTPDSSFASTSASTNYQAQDAYLILQHGDEQLHIQKQHLQHGEALSKSPFCHQGHLFFPSNAPSDSFQLLCDFLTKNEFAPTRAKATVELRIRSNLDLASYQGPPVILKPQGDALPYLASSISAYKLATILNLEPLKDRAMHRMYELPCSSEDPVGLLEKVYGAKPTLSHDDTLRTWAKKWLQRTPPGQENFRNIHILQQGEDIAAGFHRLVQAQPDLQNDIRAAGLQHPPLLPLQPQQGWAGPFYGPTPSPFPVQQPLPPFDFEGAWSTQ